MKIQLMIATADSSYADHLSTVLMQKYADTFSVGICSSAAGFGGAHCDVLLAETAIAGEIDLSGARLALLLCDDTTEIPENLHALQRVSKYQRISNIASDILVKYAAVASGADDLGGGKASVVAVWSPAGGVGKTSVALAYAARRAIDGGNVAYLDLELFSSTGVYFPEEGKSLSAVFEHIDDNAEMQLRGIRQQDLETGICYFCKPSNYDDMNILSPSDTATLVSAAARGTDCLVIDLPCVCDARARRVFELCDRLLLVTDSSKTAQTKLNIFMTQNDVFQSVESKTTLVANRGFRPGSELPGACVQLPNVQSGDPVADYKSLSASHFDI